MLTGKLELVNDLLGTALLFNLLLDKPLDPVGCGMVLLGNGDFKNLIDAGGYELLMLKHFGKHLGYPLELHGWLLEFGDNCITAAFIDPLDKLEHMCSLLFGLCIKPCSNAREAFCLCP